MIDTSLFRTRTIYEVRKHTSLPDIWELALDVGYSGVKTFSPNSYSCFPSYARKLPKGQRFLGEADKRNLLYEDESGDVWLVGANAQNMIDGVDNTSATSALYVKDRFHSAMFLVIARVGLALGMIANDFGTPNGKTISLQTGLPPAHMVDCKEDLLDVLAGTHEFKIKIGEGNWQAFKFTIPKQNIDIMEQPMGSLIAASTTKDGRPTMEARKYLASNVLVADPGFLTFDTFNIKDRRIVGNETWTDLGMSRILSETCSELYRKYSANVSVEGMQKYLEAGTVRVIDRKNRKTDDVAFGDILNECSKKICSEALAKLDETYQGLFYHYYLILTGGLGEVWFEQVKQYYAGLKTLKVISAMQTDEIEGLFSNVRGYYYNQHNRLLKLTRAKK